MPVIEMTAEEYKQYLLFKYEDRNKKKEHLDLQGQDLVDYLVKKYKR